MSRSEAVKDEKRERDTIPKRCLGSSSRPERRENRSSGVRFLRFNVNDDGTWTRARRTRRFRSPAVRFVAFGKAPVSPSPKILEREAETPKGPL
jgi:hypothetical protein